MKSSTIADALYNLITFLDNHQWLYLVLAFISAFAFPAVVVIADIRIKKRIKRQHFDEVDIYD